MVKVIHTYDANHRWSVQYEAKSTKQYLILQIMFILI